MIEIEPIQGETFAQFIFSSQDQCYPPAMREGLEVFDRLLNEKFGNYCWGAYIDDHLFCGWILFEVREDLEPPEPKEHVYCYDLAVLPRWRGKGVAKALWRHAARELRWLGYWIKAHCRKQSYPIIAGRTEGYQIERDDFIVDHYAKEYEDDSLTGEHAHEILLRPVGQ